MTTTWKYDPEDLVAIVWPRQSEPQVAAGEASWEAVARGDWAMDPNKADRVRVLIAIDVADSICGAWRVDGAEHNVAVPIGKTRSVSRSTFSTAPEPLLQHLIGMPSPRPRQRNPQTTFELRDLAGAEALHMSEAAPETGVVQLGEYTLAVSATGAELTMPIDGRLIVRVV